MTKSKERINFLVKFFRRKDASSVTTGLQEFQQLKRRLGMLRVGATLCFLMVIYMAVLMLFGKATTQGNIVFGFFIIMTGVCLFFDNVFYKQLEESLLKSINMKSHWHPEEISLKNDEVKREREVRKQDLKEGYGSYVIGRFFSLRPYGLFSDGELKFLTEKLTLLEQEMPEFTVEEEVGNIGEVVEQEARSFNKAEQEMEQLYNKWVAEFSAERAEQMMEQVKMRRKEQ